MNISRLFKAGMKYLTSADYRFLINANLGMHKRMPDEEYIKRKYKAATGKILDLENPRTFNEKLQWIKLYDRRPEYTMMVDKYLVREHISQTVGEKYLIPLLGVWEHPEDIDFDALPDQFALKCNHNSGLGMCICKDKSKLNIADVVRELKKGMAQDYYLSSREWPYKDVPRRIIAEKYMVDDSGTELRDYKVMCFGGEPKLIQYHIGRFGDHTQDFYDAQWNKLEITQGLPLSEVVLEKPVFLEEMLDLSRKLSAGMPQVRVDWYYVQGQLYFGELTFFDAAGYDEFEPAQWNEIVGSWVQLPERKEGV